jgi:hypothetical protein
MKLGLGLIVGLVQGTRMGAVSAEAVVRWELGERAARSERRPGACTVNLASGLGPFQDGWVALWPWA